jgi:transcriptional regulator with XRE-family HTH domain
MAFREMLRELREKAGLSQSGLAKKAGLSVRSIQNWEQGHRGPSAQGVFALSEGLGVPAEILLIALRKGNRKKGRPRPRGQQ